MDILLTVDLTDAAGSDDLRDTVDYGALAKDTLALVQGAPVALLETLAERISQLCLAKARVVTAEVTVHKPQAPVAAAFDDIAVVVRRGRADG